MDKKEKAFTLAEVLITLGIIGIIASLTIPQLIRSYQHKVLDSQFKKSVSTIYQLVYRMKEELGEDKLAKTCTFLIGHNEETYKYTNSAMCYEAFHNYFPQIISKKQKGSMFYDISRDKEEFLTYNKKNKVTASALAGIGYTIFSPRVLPDGSFLNMNIIESQMYFGIDVNGQKGPNRLGHDIFVFNLDKKNDTLRALSKPKEISDDDLEGKDYDHEYQKERDGYPCNINSTQKANGIGCAWYALRNECPSNPNLKYFECLPK